MKFRNAEKNWKQPKYFLYGQNTLKLGISSRAENENREPEGERGNRRQGA